MPLKVFGGSLLLPLRIDGYTFDQLPYAKQVDERFSTQLLDQLPDHVVSNYDSFLQFVEAYYEWSEQQGNPRYEGVRLGTYNDIDQTLDEYIEFFKRTYIHDFPVTLKDGINEKTIVKYAKDLYSSKGSKASFDLLFKILFDTTVSVSYPRDRILKLSTSTFDDRQFIRIEPVISIDEAKTIKNGLIVQRNPFNKSIKATARIDSVEHVSSGSLDFFSLAVQDVSGSFDDATPVEITTAGNTSAAFNASVFPTLNKLKINAGGTGYEINDQVLVKDLAGNKLLTAQVSSIGPVGDIRSLQYKENFGIYRGASGLTFNFVSFTGAGASFSPEAGEIITDGPDAYASETGKLSSRSYIQDNFFYQDFSYILRVDKTLKEFADVVRRLVHPSGSLMFAEYINESSVTAASSITAESFTNFTPIIGHYLPHTFGTTIDPRGFTYTTAAGSTHYDFYPNGYNGQDGSTSNDFLVCLLDTHDPEAGFGGLAGNPALGGPTSGGPHGTPHLFPENGITHNPDIVFFYHVPGNGTEFLQEIPFNFVQGCLGTVDAGMTAFAEILANGAGNDTRSITNGAMGGTGYIGIGSDSDGESVGLMGFFPVGSGITNSILNSVTAPKRAVGVTHYGGYTSPQETSLSGGFSGGQIIQVVGTDSATADYWVVYRHPAHLGLTDLGKTGERTIARIPMKPVVGTQTIDQFNFARDGYYGYDLNPQINLNGGATYTIGELVTQQRFNEPKAIGRVIDFIPSAFGNQGSPADGVDPFDPLFNIGTDTLVVEVLNGKFTKGILSGDINEDGEVDGLDLSLVLSRFGATGDGMSADANKDGKVDGADLVRVLAGWGQKPRPIVGESSGASRLVEQTFNPNLNTTSVTYDTSWLDIPISVMVNDITYSNVTN